MVHINRLTFRLMIPLMLLALVPGSAAILRADTPPATQPAAAAEQVAHTYCDMLKAGNAVKAIETYWNFPAMFDGMFGDDMKKQSPAERDQMRKLMLAFISQVYANPQINELMKTATFEDFTSKELPDHRMQVDFNLHLQAGQPLANTLTLQDDGGWKVVDAGVNGRSMTKEIHNEYVKAAQPTTPLQFMQSMGRSGK